MEFRCPKCNSSETLYARALVWVKVTMHELSGGPCPSNFCTEVPEAAEHYIDDDTELRCEECDFTAKVKSKEFDFDLQHQKFRLQVEKEHPELKEEKSDGEANDTGE